MILLHEAADAGDFRHARHAGELVTHEPILHRAQPAEIVTAIRGLGGIHVEVVLIHPAEPAGVRTELRLHGFGHVGLKVIQPLQHPRPGEVGIHAFLEDDREEGEPKHGSRAHILDSGEPLQAGGKRESHLILDFLRTAPHPVGVNEHLVFSQVGDRVHRRPEHRAHAERDEHQRAAQHEETILQAPFDEAGDHSEPPNPKLQIPEKRQEPKAKTAESSTIANRLMA